MKKKKTILPTITILQWGLASTVYANNIASSSIGVGLKNMFSDLSTYGMVLGPIVGGAFAIYFLIRRAGADDMDGKMWKNRVVTACVCGAGVFAVSGIISLFTSYIQ